MAVEIERKFLVNNEVWTPNSEGERLVQGYLNTEPERTVRVRVKGGAAYLTIKGKNEGAKRLEFEYEVPLADGEAMLNLCSMSVEKRRYKCYFGGMLWEVDVFEGENEGLLLAEIELQSEGQYFQKPLWLGKEVTNDRRYYNSNLAIQPFLKW